MWGSMGFGMGGRGALPDKFEEQYHCYSAAMADKSHLEVSLFVVCFPLATHWADATLRLALWLSSMKDAALI